METHLLNLLKTKHNNPGCGIKASMLASSLGISAREVRKLVERLRLKATPICGLPATGYYYSENPQDINRTAAFLTRRAHKSLAQATAIKKMPELDLFKHVGITTFTDRG